MRSPRLRATLIRLAVPLALLLVASPSQAQRATEAELKAAFLLNFAKFTEWPLDVLAPGAPITFCVVDHDRIAAALEAAIPWTRVSERALSLERRTLNNLLPSCHVLFVPGLSDHPAATVVETLKDTPTFTVSDTPAFTRAGGVAYLYIDGEQVRFAINVQAAQRARLKISSRMLGLAKIVQDGPR